MLEPKDRQTLLQLLRPPLGCRFDCAIGTTFSLDLMALLTAPLAMAMFDWQDAEGELAGDPSLSGLNPLELLESLRRCADRVHIFCQAGQICVPPAHQRLLTYLEQSVVQVLAPAARQKRRGVFHPKVWVLRYLDGSQAPRYRLLCLTRNLTFDRSWDAVAALDGIVRDRERGLSVNRPLVQFLEALPGMRVHPREFTAQGQTDLSLIVSEIAKVQWEVPAPLTSVAFHPLGLTGRSPRPFPQSASKALVVSPFLSAEFLSRFGESPDTRFLVSRPESLRELDPAMLKSGWTCYTLKDETEDLRGADPAAAAVSGDNALSGLHAKVFVLDNGHNSHIWVGSANATSAAFESNVEFLVELVGPRKSLGVNAMLGREDLATGLWPLLTRFEPGESAVVTDKDSKEAESLVDLARVAIASLPWRAKIRPVGTGFGIELRCDEPVIVDPRVGLRCRPVSLSAGDMVVIPTGTPVAADFGERAEESITSFFAFEATARVGTVEKCCAFVVNVPLDGAPADRKERVLRSLLKDSKTLLRYLLLLLADDPEAMFQDLRVPADNGSAWSADGEWMPLLEQLLRAVDRSPERVEQVQRLIDELRRTPEGQQIVPPALDSILGPISRVCQEMRSSKAASR